ncbi:hypothetical protein BD413DRAFT_245026 [Trametes elegans]|nr:hypothetical protein BD413DRAFT_245026 [Trametes elegans]
MIYHNSPAHLGCIASTRRPCLCFSKFLFPISRDPSTESSVRHLDTSNCRTALTTPQNIGDQCAIAALQQPYVTVGPTSSPGLGNQAYVLSPRARTRTARVHIAAVDMDVSLLRNSVRPRRTHALQVGVRLVLLCLPCAPGVRESVRTRAQTGRSSHFERTGQGQLASSSVVLAFAATRLRLCTQACTYWMAKIEFVPQLAARRSSLNGSTHMTLDSLDRWIPMVKTSHPRVLSSRVSQDSEYATQITAMSHTPI